MPGTRRLIAFFCLMAIITAYMLAHAAYSARLDQEGFYDQRGHDNIYARSLSGRVLITNVANPVEGFVVEWWSRNWKRRLERRITTDKGSFSFSNVPPGKYYLKYYKRGYYGGRAIVIVNKQAENELQLVTEPK